MRYLLTALREECAGETVDGVVGCLYVFDLSPGAVKAGPITGTALVF